MIEGKAIIFGNNIDTDQILGAHHLVLPTIGEMAGYTFEHHAHFTSGFAKGDILVAGDNFGCGSSREQAAAVLKERGVAAVIARGFARIFFRNAINLGLQLIVCPEASEIAAKDKLTITAEKIRNETTGKEYAREPLPPFVAGILKSGGIIPYLQKNR